MQIIHTLSAVVVGGLLTTFCQLILPNLSDFLPKKLTRWAKCVI